MHTTRIVYGLVFAHQHERNSLSKFAEDTVGSIDVVPDPGVCKGCLEKKNQFTSKERARDTYIANSLGHGQSSAG